MTIISYLFPTIHAKESADAKPKIKRRGFNLDHGNCGKGKYDHRAMIEDRLNGLLWKDIAIKHGVPNDPDGSHTRRLVENSAASNRLKPFEIAKIFNSEK